MFYALDVAKDLKPHYVMKNGQFKASLMKADRLVGDGVFGLPQGIKIPTYPIRALPGCPDDWGRDKGTYVCPVDANWGLWFDWTQNDPENTAVIPSVKGMNPITGDYLQEFSLESYTKKCPRHKIPFEEDLFCEKCNYKWPPQSYVCKPNTLWWDGFRQADGTVRQFFFTEDEKRDIASHVIGKDLTVPAFGFAFFEPKVRRQIFGGQLRGITAGPVEIAGPIGPEGGIGVTGPVGPSDGWVPTGSWQSTGQWSVPVVDNITYDAKSPRDATYMCCCLDSEQRVLDLSDPKKNELKKQVVVGAGARIDQELQRDPNPISEWKSAPSAIIKLYFVLRKEFDEIVAQGVTDPDGYSEGYLKGLPVG